LEEDSKKKRADEGDVAQEDKTEEVYRAHGDIDMQGGYGR
jgi:hypothetical protein